MIARMAAGKYIFRSNFAFRGRNRKLIPTTRTRFSPIGSATQQARAKWPPLGGVLVVYTNMLRC